MNPRPVPPSTTQQSQGSSPNSTHSSASEDHQFNGLLQRGRRQSERESGRRDNDDNVTADDTCGTIGTSRSKQRKRKRSRKGIDNKFDCPYKLCGKSYSRAEHLYRHQLNRTSTIISKEPSVDAIYR